MIHISVKTFQELQPLELYNLLRLRSAVFVVEQQCVYEDLDGKDIKAIHVIGYKGAAIVAYTRLFKPGDYMEKASIGRVVVKQSERKYGYGIDIMKASIAAIEQHFEEQEIQLSAQFYLKKFYNGLGFREIGETYLEDGIPHILMEKGKD
jgi:ElaA protein